MEVNDRKLKDFIDGQRAETAVLYDRLADAEAECSKLKVS
jgi:hypothetical protein